MAKRFVLSEFKFRQKVPPAVCAVHRVVLVLVRAAVRVYDAFTGDFVRDISYPGLGGAVVTIAAAGGMLMVLTKTHGVLAFDIGTGEYCHTLDVRGVPLFLSMSPEVVIVGCSDGKFKVFARALGSYMHTLPPCDEWVSGQYPVPGPAGATIMAGYQCVVMPPGRKPFRVPVPTLTSAWVDLEGNVHGVAEADNVMVRVPAKGGKPTIASFAPYFSTSQYSVAYEPSMNLVVALGKSSYNLLVFREVNLRRAWIVSCVTTE
jgi:hypothetical protein